MRMNPAEKLKALLLTDITPKRFRRAKPEGESAAVPASAGSGILSRIRERLPKLVVGKRHFTVDDLPSTQQLEDALHAERYHHRYHSVVRSTVYILVTVAAVAILVATLWMPVLQIYGTSMQPTLSDGEIVVSTKSTDFKTGEVIAFYLNNKILVKRVMAGPGDWIDIDDYGIVYVNGQALDEPYIDDPSIGDCNIALPYQVPDEKYFVMGDHRSVSIDSRKTSVGCVSNEQIVGRIVFCIWPAKSIHAIS